MEDIIIIFFFCYFDIFRQKPTNKSDIIYSSKGGIGMRLTDKQLKRFTEVFEIKAKSIIMIDKGRKVTIAINGVRIFDVKKELVQEFL